MLCFTNECAVELRCIANSPPHPSAMDGSVYGTPSRFNARITLTLYAARRASATPRYGVLARESFADHSTARTCISEASKQLLASGQFVHDSVLHHIL